MIKQLDILLYKIVDQLKGYRVIKLPYKFYNLVAVITARQIGLQDNFFVNRLLTNEEKTNILISTEKRITSRTGRTVPPKIVADLSGEMIEELLAVLPPINRFHLNDFYYRLVRNERDSKISVVHRDCYFHEITPGWEFGSDEINVKLWIPLFCPSNKAIGVRTGSHLDENINDAKIKRVKDIVEFESPHCREILEPVLVKEGEGLLFPSSLIHGSLPYEQLDEIRCSVELTLVFKVNKD
tara:strand:+ start:2814 stop:3533 length:720 start_codon:yes stop_codon:yes gene_type:complete